MVYYPREEDIVCKLFVSTHAVTPMPTHSMLEERRCRIVDIKRQQDQRRSLHVNKAKLRDKHHARVVHILVHWTSTVKENIVV